jgi:diguanylate cyclase (GGDEF)-like protein
MLPLAAVFWGFSRVVAESETRLVDARLQAGVRAALAAYDERQREASTRALRLARDPRFARALARRDRQALAALLRGKPNLVVLGRDRLHVGVLPPSAGRRAVAVVGRDGSLGQVVATVPLDRMLVRQLELRSGIDAGDRLAFVRRAKIVAGNSGIGGELPVTAGLTDKLRVGGDRYRTLAVSRPGTGGALLALLTPQARIDSANASDERRLLAGLLTALLLIAAVAYLEGRSIVRTVRGLVHAANEIARGRLGQRAPVRGRDALAVLARSFNEMASQLQERLAELEAERRRLRNAVGRFADALGATHDLEQLVRVILETAVEATTAVGGSFVGAQGELVEVGDTRANGDELQVPLSRGSAAFGVLRLLGPGFSADDVLTANALGHQAAVALDNLRLHRIVEQQALVDGLTGLANRRECEAALDRELARAARHDLQLALVLADLDDFKVVNDVHGHPFGDAVLREFAAVLRQTARDSDLAGRWGGEEFVLVLPGTDPVGALRLAERVRGALERRTILAPDGRPLRVTASFGVAVFPHAPGHTQLIASADAALYEAKRGGKNRVEAAPSVREPR